MTFPALTVMVLVPLLGAAVSWRARDDRAAWRVAVAASTAALAMSLIGLLRFREDLGDEQFTERLFRVPGVGMVWHLGVDGLSVPLLALACFIALAVLGASPRQSLDRRSITGLLVTLSMTLGVFSAQDLLLFALFWVLRLVPGKLLIGRAATSERVGRTYTIFLLFGSLPLVLGVLALGALGHQAHASAPFDLPGVIDRGVPANWQPWLFLMFIASIVMRMAIAPFHAWLPVLIQRGPLGVAILISSVHVALLALGRLVPVLPEASIAGLPVLAGLALLSAFYGSVLALVQIDLRRMLGFIAVSHAGFMMMGLSAMNAEGVHGAALQSIASGATLTGLLLLAGALHARTGTSRMDDFGGVARRSPRMAVSFLLFSVASVGFPGTMTFVSEDLLLHGILHAHPFVATLLLVTTALNGVSLVRAFLRVFLGPVGSATEGIELDLLPRERIVMVALSALVIVGGFMPTPFVQVREGFVQRFIADVPRAAGQHEGVTHAPHDRQE